MVAGTTRVEPSPIQGILTQTPTARPDRTPIVLGPGDGPGSAGVMSGQMVAGGFKCLLKTKAVTPSETNSPRLNGTQVY